MNTRLISILMSLFLSLVLTQVRSQSNTWIEGELIVHLKHESTISLRTTLWSKLPQGVQYRKIADKPMLLYLVNYDTNKLSETQLTEWLTQEDRVIQWQRNHIIEPRKTPNDPLFGNQYHLNNSINPNSDIDATQAWDITTGGTAADGSKVAICILDNGVDADEIDIAGNLWTNTHEIPKNGIDDDNNGYIDDYKGWSVNLSSDSINTGGNHGTEVTSVAAGKGNNTHGISGVMWDASVVFVNYGTPSEANAIAAYAYPYNLRKQYNESNGAKGAFIVVTNTSWGRDRVKAESSPLWCAMYDSLGSVGILSVGATSNQNVDVDSDGDLPTSCTSPYLISVNNINKEDNKNTCGYGRKSIDIGTYGTSISTMGASGPGTATGTSVAAPIVTGIVGLMYSTSCDYLLNTARTNPSKAAIICRDVLLNSAIPIPSLADNTSTGGKANALRALQNVQNLCDNCLKSHDISFTTTDDQIKIQYDANISGTSVDFRLRRVDGINWDFYTGYAPGEIVSLLDACTEYEIQVKHKCGAYNTEYGYSRFVRTTGCCYSPIATAKEVNADKVRIEWNQSEGVNTFILFYRPINSPVWDSINVIGKAYELTNLTQCTKYEVVVASRCGAKSSPRSTSIYISTSCGSCTSLPYCRFNNKNDAFEWIDSTTFGSIVVTKHEFGQGGYTDHTGAQTAVFEAEKSYSFKTTFKYKDNVITNENYRLYIDYNQNGEFEPSEELAKLNAKIKNGFSTVITIDPIAKSGFTKMRQMLVYDDFSGSCDNASFKFGEVEDFCIEIIGKVDVDDNIEFLKVQPNPGNDQVSIHTDGLLIQNIDIYHTNGQRVLSAQPNISNVTFDAKSLASGVFMIHIKLANGKSVVKKWVKL